MKTVEKGPNNGNTLNENKNTAHGAVAKTLRDLFIDELKDIYWAEQKLTQAIPKMIENATSENLKTALTDHLEETQNHIIGLEDVFTKIGENAEAKKCEAIAGITKEAEQIMEETEEGNVRDAGIISAGQKVEHYEIATYGTLISFAETLGEEDAALLLKDTLKEEKAADKKLSHISDTVNVAADTEKE